MARLAIILPLRDNMPHSRGTFFVLLHLNLRSVKVNFSSQRFVELWSESLKIEMKSITRLIHGVFKMLECLECFSRERVLEFREEAAKYQREESKLQDKHGASGQRNTYSQNSKSLDGNYKFSALKP